MDNRKVIYYQDELNDEFSVAQITPRKIDSSYTYCYHSFFKRFTHFFWYRVVASPIAWLYLKIVFHHKIVGKNKLKPFRKSAFVMYGNHTQDIADAFIPTMVCFPKDVYVIVHPNNVSMPFLGKVTPSMGALPLPDDLHAYRNFLSAIQQRLEESHALMIYPEAHIWPYYTKIRPFPDKSFHYPIKYQVPVFCFTNTYQARKHSKNPRIVTYVDGPFYPDDTLPAGQQKKDLRDKVYNAMQKRSALSTVEVIKYIKKEEKDG